MQNEFEPAWTSKEKSFLDLSHCFCRALGIFLENTNA